MNRRRTAAATQRRREARVRVSLDQNDRGKGGRANGGAGGVDEVHMTSRGRVERRPLARHGASAMAHSEGEGREREADSGGPLSDI